MRRIFLATGMLVLLVALVAVAVVAPRAGAGEPTSDAMAPAPERRPTVVAFGDSLLSEAQEYLVRVGGASGFDVRPGSWGGTAICDWFDDVSAVGATPDAFVFAFSGNSISPCMRDGRGALRSGAELAAEYADDVNQAMYLVGGVVPVYWVIAPIPRDPGRAADARLVAAAIERTASSWPNATVVDANRFISPAGVWSQAQPCLPFEPCQGLVAKGVPSNVVRSPDGAHFCPDGAEPVDGVTVRCGGYSSGAMRYALTVLGAMAPLREVALQR